MDRFGVKLSTARVYFTHFVQVDYTPNKEKLLGLFCRGAAVLCKPAQCGVDFLVPILFAGKKKEYELTEENISAVLVQVKNEQSKKYPANKINISKMRASKFGLESTAGTSYFCLYVQFAGSPLQSALVRSEELPDDWPEGMDAETIDEEEERQCGVYLRGLSNEIYPFLEQYKQQNEESGQVENQIRILLRANVEVLNMLKEYTAKMTPEEAREIEKTTWEMLPYIHDSVSTEVGPKDNTTRLAKETTNNEPLWTSVKTHLKSMDSFEQWIEEPDNFNFLVQSKMDSFLCWADEQEDGLHTALVKMVVERLAGQSKKETTGQSCS